MAGDEQAAGRTGLVLVNLGTPDRADVPAVRRYLAQFLSDRRVIELSPLLWQPVLHGLILRRRPPLTAANYRKIWDVEHDESPLLRFTRLQAEALAAACPGIEVRFAMRYGEPSIERVLDGLLEAGCRQLLLAPLYPQYSSATTGTVLEEAFRVLARRRELPAVASLPPYYADPAYIGALRQSLDEQLSRLDFVPERIIQSFHGMPERTTALGDPYRAHCHETARLLRQAMGRTADEMPIAFQSRFGPAEWLKPYLLPLVGDLARAGVRRLAVITPGFAADCLETLEEVAMQVRDAFLAAGGEHYAAIPCLNDSPPGLAMLQQLLADALPPAWGRSPAHSLVQQTGRG